MAPVEGCSLGSPHLFYIDVEGGLNTISGKVVVTELSSEVVIIVTPEYPSNPVTGMDSAEAKIRGIALSGEMWGEAPKYAGLIVEPGREISPPVEVIPKSPKEPNDTTDTVIDTSGKGVAAPNDLAAVSSPMRCLSAFLVTFQ